MTSALGPVLGGWLLERASWHWLFLIDVPLAAIVLGVSLWQVPESRDLEASPKLDWVGAVLAVVGLGGIVYGLIESSSQGFGNVRVWGAISIGSICLGAFIIVEARLSAPMVPLKLFRSRTFSGTNLLTFLLYAALGGALFFLPFNLDSSAALRAYSGGCGTGTVSNFDVSALAVFGRIGRSLWCQEAANYRPDDCRDRTRIDDLTQHRWQLLDDIFPRRRRAGVGHGDYSCTPDYDGDGGGVSALYRRSFGD